MRKDVYIQNDSGGFSVIAGDAIDAVIEDQRSDDMQFVTAFKVLLLELYGDDSMPVRLVVDEPLRRDETEQWLARTSWRIDAADGRLVVMGGFDPDVLASWKDETGGSADGDCVAVAEVPAGPLRVDVYAHVGSMNGRQILSEARKKPGAAFRERYPDRPFPLWLTRILEFPVEPAMMDAASPSPIGFLVHVQPGAHEPGDPPEGGWFPRDTNARVPATFPLGIASNVEDPDIEALRDRLVGRGDDAAETPRPVSTTVEIIEQWTGDPLTRIADNVPPIALAPADAYWLFWIAAFTKESPPRFEYLIEPKGSWTPPPASEDVGVIQRGAAAFLRPPSDAGGWALWRGAKSAAASFGALADGSTITLATAPRERQGEDVDPEIGRALFEGMITKGSLELTHASPAVDRATLADALELVADVIVRQQIRVRGAAERQAFDLIAAIYVPEEDRRQWDGDIVRLHEPDERELVLLATAVFRARFGTHWKCDAS